MGLTVYRLNEQAFLTAYEALAAQTMQLASFSGDEIRGTIRVEQAGRLIFSIANEAGWESLCRRAAHRAGELCGSVSQCAFRAGVA